ncbi:MAG: hypothetical protein ABMA64_39540, partial [Myxococcota bacterium]
GAHGRGDLAGLAAERLPRVAAKVPPVAPRAHPAWAHVAFLEQEADRPGRIRSFLSMFRLR